MSSFSSSRLLAFFAIIALAYANELVVDRESRLAQVTYGLVQSFESETSLASQTTWADRRTVKKDVFTKMQITKKDPTKFVQTMIDEYGLLPKQISPSMVFLEFSISQMTDICLLSRQSIYTASKGITSHDLTDRHAAFMEIAHLFGQYGQTWYLKYEIFNFTSKTQDEVYHEWSNALIHKCENVNGRFSQELARGQDHAQGMTLLNEIKDELKSVKDELTKATQQLGVYLPFFKHIQSLLENVNGTVVEVRKGVEDLVGQQKYAMDIIVKYGIKVDTLQEGVDQLGQKVDKQSEKIGDLSEKIDEQAEKIDELVWSNWFWKCIAGPGLALLSGAQFLFANPAAIGYISGGFAFFKPFLGRCWNKMKSCRRNDKFEHDSTDADFAALRAASMADADKTEYE